jgi:hypothetical protein
MLGWNFPTLTKQSLALCEPDRKLDPPAGYLTFGADTERLGAAVKEGVALFIMVRDAILAEPDWQMVAEEGNNA